MPVCHDINGTIRNFKNRGFKEVLNNKGIIVDSEFLGMKPTSKFDIYAIVWSRENNSRTINDKIRVELAHKDISRGW